MCAHIKLLRCSFCRCFSTDCGESVAPELVVMVVHDCVHEVQACHCARPGFSKHISEFVRWCKSKRRATLCYMKTVTHREMRNNSGEIIRAVAAGETFQVTNNGQIAAVISPPNSGSLDRLVEQGQARPARSSVTTLSTIRRRTSQLTSAKLLKSSRGRW